MTCKEFEELSGAYALDAITPAERQAAEAHLATCTRCASLARELSEVVILLPLADPQVSPSAAVKERIFATIRQEGKGATHPIPQAQPRQPTFLTRARRQPRSLR